MFDHQLFMVKSPWWFINVWIHEPMAMASQELVDQVVRIMQDYPGGIHGGSIWKDLLKQILIIQQQL